MKTSATGLAFIARHEAPAGQAVLKAYRDAAGIPTIGIGTTHYPGGKAVQMGDICTAIEAQAWFAHDLAVVENAINATVTVSLTQGQFDALVSFTYNEGISAEKHSTLLKLLNQGRYREAAAQFVVWDIDHEDGKAVASPGLLKRRQDEQAMFLQGVSR